MEIDPRALTEDGYLKDQDYLKNFPYGRYPTSFNGCGWVAIYSMRSDRALRRRRSTR